MQKINWGLRSQDAPIAFAGAEQLCEGCIVDLEHEGTRVSVRVQSHEGQAWTGEITGFPQCADTCEIGDLKVGTTVQFEDNQVLRCAA